MRVTITGRDVVRNHFSFPSSISPVAVDWLVNCVTNSFKPAIIPSFVN